ncbi:unnamed protein product [Arctogadus glacialis]
MDLLLRSSCGILMETIQLQGPLMPTVAEARLGEPPDPAFMRSPSKDGLHVSTAGVWYTVCMTSRREDTPVAVSGEILVFNRLKGEGQGMKNNRTITARVFQVKMDRSYRLPGDQR